MQSLARPISDHVPYTLVIGTHIPRSSQFRFENYWADFTGFSDIASLHWHNNHFYANMAKTISGKFKQLIKGLKAWSKEISLLSKLINNCNWVLVLLDGLEEQISTSRVESNFKLAVKKHLLDLLEAKRSTGIKEQHTDGLSLVMKTRLFFHLMATIAHRRNFISHLPVATS